MIGRPIFVYYNAISLNFNTNTRTTLTSQVKILLENHIKTPTCFGLRPSSGSYNILAKVNII